MCLTLFYNYPRLVIPAKAGIQTENTGFRIKSGMTKCVELFLRQYTTFHSLSLMMPLIESVRLSLQMRSLHNWQPSE